MSSMMNLDNLSKPSVQYSADHVEQHTEELNLANKVLEHEGKEGYVLDAGLADSEEGIDLSHLKRAPDGHTILIPQPSDDPNDPLNWSRFKKHYILYIIGFTAFLADYGSATGAGTLVAQGEEWNMSPDDVNHSQSGNVFMLGAGGFAAIILSAYFGRLPVAFYFLVVNLATAIYCTVAPNFKHFMAARVLNGFFSTVTQGGGLMFIKDIFFFHEHARKINVWSAFYILSPYLGPFAAGFIVNVTTWRWCFGLFTILSGIGLILVTLFVDETFYDRTIPPEKQPARGTRVERVLGIAQWRSRHLRNSFKDAYMRTVKTATRMPVIIGFCYYMLTFAWVVGINTTLALFLTPSPPSGYGFSSSGVSFFYFTPMIATVFGEIFGHYFNDFIAVRYIRRHKGHFEPEARLTTIYVGSVFVIAGLILSGFALQHLYHWAILAVGWGLYVFGVMLDTVAILAYLLDCYPEASGEVAAIICMGRTVGGFIVSYFQVKWADATGAAVSFGTQAAISAAAVLLIVLLQFRGHRLREWSGPLNFKTV
ncbi:major facilitator superfamily domain-containing protein [Lipomyces oligophaga]|uniref:major facilitator superfamily domain-containing protein n=1 Tax=Lipomyces oligophaga TaxID=45792 RepID=UPI0034CD74BE